MKKYTLFFVGLLVSILAFGYFSFGVRAADETVVVYPDDLATSFADVTADNTKWYYFDDETNMIDPLLGSYVVGPDTPPLGEESVQFTVSGTERKNLATSQFGGVMLADITHLGFSTYNPSAGNGGDTSRSAYLHFNVDFDGSDTWQSRLVYVPRDNGTVNQDEWQDWDAIMGGSAMWRYSGANWPISGEPGLSTTKTWDEIKALYPDAKMHVSYAWLGLRVGEPYADGYTENVDKLVFGTAEGSTTFDFDADSEAPDAMIDSPMDGDVVSGMVDVWGTITDESSFEYRLRIFNSSGTRVVNTGWMPAGESLLNENLYTWDSTTLPDGEYRIRLIARDDYGNRDRGSRDTVTVTLNNTPDDKDQCKKGGWESFYTPEFKNQGDCVSFVQSNEKALGNKNK